MCSSWYNNYLTLLKVHLSQDCFLFQLSSTNFVYADDGDMEPSHNPLAIEVFVQTLLSLGSKSFTHTFAGLAKYHSVFKVNLLSIKSFAFYLLVLFSFLERL